MLDDDVNEDDDDEGDDDINPFDPESIDELFDDLPLFPISGVILLPGCYLPLRIHEPRYLELFDHAISNLRMLGIIQPEQPGETGSSPDFERRKSRQPALQKVGTAGRIVKFEENSNGSFDIVIKGMCRFDLVSDRLLRYGFRLGDVNYLRFAEDIQPQTVELDREEMVSVFQAFLDLHEIKVSWEQIEQQDYERFINTIASVAPFSALEKQVLLECATLPERYLQMLMMMRMAVMDQQLGSDPSTMN